MEFKARARKSSKTLSFEQKRHAFSNRHDSKTQQFVDSQSVLKYGSRGSSIISAQRHNAACAIGKKTTLQSNREDSPDLSLDCGQASEVVRDGEPERFNPNGFESARM